MNTLNNGFEGPDSRLAAVVRGAIVCLLMAGAVLIGSGMNRDGAHAADAAAPVATDENWTTGYFPASFPAPQGDPEDPIATF